MDFLSNCPVLTEIFVYLYMEDDILRCMRVNKNFHHCITENWPIMSKSQVTLKFGETFYVGPERNYVSADEMDELKIEIYNCRGSRLELKLTNTHIWFEDYYISQFPCIRTLLSRFPIISKEYKNCYVNEGNGVIKFFEIKVSVPNIVEAFRTVLEFILQKVQIFDFQMLELQRRLPLEILDIVVECFEKFRHHENTRDTVVFSRFGPHRTKIHDTFRGKMRVQPWSTTILDNSIIFLNTEWQIIVDIASIRKEHMEPMKNLLMEWSEGKRNIKSLKFGGRESCRRWPFKTEEWNRVIAELPYVSIERRSGYFIQFWLSREKDTKTLRITYNSGKQDYTGDYLHILEDVRMYSTPSTTNRLFNICSITFTKLRRQ